MRRRRRLELIVVLPDGSTLLVPAAWTDLESSASDAAPSESVEAGVLAGLDDLFAARRVLDGLVDRVVWAERDDRGEGADRAVATGTDRESGTGGGAVGAGRRVPAPERDGAADRVDRADACARGAGR